MKQIKLLRIAHALFVWVLFVSPATMHGEVDPRAIQQHVGELLQKAHFSQKRLDDELSKAFLRNLLEDLDYSRLYFTQKDVDLLTAKYATTLDDDMILGNADPAHRIFDLFRKRVEERVAKVKELLKANYDFSSTRTVELDRSKAPWPRDEAAADELWRTRIEGELLDRRLMAGSEDPVKVVSRRYDRVLRYIREQDREDVLSRFLTVLAQTYDPHSEYLSKSQLDSFNINMRLSLVGVGAVLTQDEGYAKIRELVPGGPASRDGRLKVGDRITGVAQGKEEFVDTLDLKLDKVVEMIRGKKNTLVRLQVWPAAATDSSVRKVIEITRAEVKLTEQEAKAELIEHISPDGSKSKLGWIVLPSFYAEMERTGSPDAKSTTRDVLVLINRLKKEGIDGLVIDLRRNGGGSLEEAVNLTGLFIKRGPVVLARDSSGHNSTLRDKDDRIAYDGPLVVLTNRLSASASEIFAAALQDYGRAIVVGDTATFGKGTVQTMVDLARTMPFAGASSGAGALKLTIQKFYRVAGGSTQLQGVVSDIHLPSLYDQTEIGEASLKGPLPYDTIDPVDFERWSLPLYINEIKKRSMSRVSSDREFQWIMEDTARYKKRVAENSLSLNEKARRTEIEADKARKERREKERAAIVVEPDKAFAITIAKADGGPLEPVIREAKKKSPEVAVSAAPGADLGTGGEPKKVVESPVPAGQPANSAAGVSDDDAADDESGPEVAVDAIRLETVRILGDLIELTKAGTKSVVPVAPVPLNPQNTAQTR